ncbi:unnamed protein product [Rotaria sp. Silwood2]|nr:unnamed protein product [Rotaria sp. Silwood2]
MSFNDWLSSSSISRQPLSTTTNFNDAKQHHHYHYHYHYHYAPMTTAIFQPLYSHCQHQCCQQYDSSNSFALVSSMPISNHQVSLKYKENFHRNSTLKLRRCVVLFLNLIDNSSISDFLQYDKHFRHADKVRNNILL